MFCYDERQKYAKSKAILIDCLNIYNCEILENDVYFSSKKNKDYRIFKINFENLFPENSTDCTICITNKYYSHQLHIPDNLNNDNCLNKEEVDYSKSIYLSIGKFDKIDKLSVYYSYKEDGKTYRLRCDLYLEIKCIGDIIYISQYKINNIRRVFRKFEKGSKSILDIFTNTSKVFEIYDYPIEYHVLNAIKLYDSFNYEIKFDEQVNSEFDTRKWLLHDDQFGTGKSTIDLYFAMQQGYQPVMVSPWEENYDKDILHLIYSKMLKHNRGNFFSNILAAISTRAFIFWPIAAAAVIVFFDNDIVKGIFDIIYYRILDTLFSSFSIARDVVPLGLHEIRDIFFVVSSIIISYIGLSSFILFKKESTRDYQDFYIKRIQSILKQNPHIFLIVEDIDRLDSDVYNNVFRILSLLNKEFNNNNNNMLGLISLNRKIIEQDNLSNEKAKEKMLFETIENKIIYGEIAKNYDYQVSIRRYIDEGIEFLCACGGNKYELEEEYRSTKITNFRDAHKCMEEILKKYYSSKQEK